MPPEKIQSNDNQSGLTAVNSDNKSKSNAKVPGFEDNSSEATKAKELRELLSNKRNIDNELFNFLIEEINYYDDLGDTEESDLLLKEAEGLLMQEDESNAGISNNIKSGLVEQPTIEVCVKKALSQSVDELSQEVIISNLKKEFRNYPGGLFAATKEPVFAEVFLEEIRTKQSKNWNDATNIQDVPSVEWTNEELQYWNVRHYTNKVMITLGQDLGDGFFKVAAIAPPSFTEILSTATLSALSGSGGSTERSSYISGNKVMLANAAGASKSGHTTSIDWVNIGNVGDTFYGLFYQEEPATGKTPAFIKDATYFAKWGIEEFGVGWASSDWLGTAKDSRKEDGQTPKGIARGGELSDIIADIYPKAPTRTSKTSTGLESITDKEERREKFAEMSNFEVKKHGPMKVGNWNPISANLNKLNNYYVDTNKGAFVKFKALLPENVKEKLD